MKYQPFLIEQFFRKYDFHTEITLCSSGVQPYTLGELRRLLDLTQEDLDGIALRDSYSHGIPQLRQAVADRFGTGDPDEVLVTHGSSEAIYLLMHALLRPGDEVVSLHPSYQSHYSLAEDLGCRVKYWRLRSDEGFAANLDELRQLLTPRTKMVTVNFPNNPTGQTLSRKEFELLLGILEGTQAYLVWDNAFGELIYEGEPLPNPRRFLRRAISLETLSKSYGLAGLRVGWCHAPREVIDACVEMRDYTTLNLSPLNEYLALWSVQKIERLLGPRLGQARANRQLLGDWIARQQGRVAWTPPRGGVSAFLHLPGEDAEGFCERLTQDRGVFVLPGTCFGHPGHIRLGFGGAAEELAEGLQRISMT